MESLINTTYVGETKRVKHKKIIFEKQYSKTLYIGCAQKALHLYKSIQIDRSFDLYFNAHQWAPTLTPKIYSSAEYLSNNLPVYAHVELHINKAHMIDLHICLIDCASTHIILCNKEFFHHIEDQASFDIKTIAGSCIGQGWGPASIQLPSGVFLEIHDAIYAPTSLRNLLTFADVWCHGYH